jgi:hypothetical protein
MRFSGVERVLFSDVEAFFPAGREMSTFPGRPVEGS